MGVKELWSVLSPVCQKTSLYDLHGKTVAVDLSCWVCEGQCVGEKVATTQPRMYLRNVYFRTHTLLMMNVTPVFVLDGDAPELKHDVMKQRNIARFKQRTQTSSEEMPVHQKKGSRSRFKGILKQCRNMLEMMGVVCLQSEGEAEALCGQLNQDGLVDGVITQDSDVFLYGATTVYRNLTIKNGTGIIESYRMVDIEDKLHLTREKLVAMSLLCGCDYDQAGVHGIGKETASKYLMNFHGDVLERLRLLKTDKKLLRYESEKENCSKCSHSGKLGEHKRLGCPSCQTAKGCTDDQSPLAFKNLSDDERKKVVLELGLRRKALLEPNFPNEDTISEFLHTNQVIPCTDFSWKSPNLPKLCAFCGNMLEWELDYAFEKCLPLQTRWQLVKSVPVNQMALVPSNILKKRIVKAVACFDLAWTVADDNIEGFLVLLTEECKVLVDGCVVTTEPQIVIQEQIPDLYDEFTEQNTKKKTKVGKSKRKPKDVQRKDEDDLVLGLDNLSFGSEISSKKKTTKKKSREKDVVPVDEHALVSFSDLPVSDNTSHDTVSNSASRSGLSDLPVILGRHHPAESPKHPSYGNADTFSHDTFDLPYQDNDSYSYMDYQPPSSPMFSEVSFTKNYCGIASKTKEFKSNASIKEFDVIVLDDSDCDEKTNKANSVSHLMAESIKDKSLPYFNDWELPESCVVNNLSNFDLNQSEIDTQTNTNIDVNFSIGFSHSASSPSSWDIDRSKMENHVTGLGRTHGDSDRSFTVADRSFNDDTKAFCNESTITDKSYNYDISTSADITPLDKLNHDTKSSDNIFSDETFLPDVSILATSGVSCNIWFDETMLPAPLSSTLNLCDSFVESKRSSDLHLSSTLNLCDSFVDSKKSINLGDSSFDDDSTVDYDVSQIVDDILSRKRLC